MICVIGDTHGDYSRFSHKSIKKLGNGDFLIVCGDFGFVWDGSAKEKGILKKIGSKRYTTLFLAGCHDNYGLLEQYGESDFLGGRARNISGRLYMLSSGSVFDLNGTRIFAFGGGYDASGDDPFTENGSITDEQRNAAENALRIHGGEVDYVFTHEPPQSIGEFLEMGSGKISETGAFGIFFDGLKSSIKFKMWFFGKLHKNKLIPPKYAAVFDEPYIIS